MVGSDPPGECSGMQSAGMKARAPAWKLTAAGRRRGILFLVIAPALALALVVACDGEEKATEGPPTTAVAPCDALQGLEKYRYTFHFRLERGQPAATPTEGGETPAVPPASSAQTLDYNLDAAYVAPDSFEASLDFGGAKSSIIAIGSRRWTKSDGNWRESDLASIDYQPLPICRAVIPNLGLAAAEPQPEKVGKASALRYAFPRTASGAALAGIFGPGSDTASLITEAAIDLWLAEKGGWPLRLEIRGSGRYPNGRELRLELWLELRDVNSGGIEVKPPSPSQ